MGAGSRVSKVGLSGAEPLRSELLAFQMSECATEMEDDLRVQVGSLRARFGGDGGCWVNSTGPCCSFPPPRSLPQCHSKRGIR